jgi:glycosyltransferase involved in cell wall biosynthesis
MRAYGVPRDMMTIIPHGVSPTFADGDATLFEQTHGLRDFVLCVGRFEHPRKNQLALVRAMKDVKAPLVFIGGAEPGSEWYLEQCRRDAGANTKFLPACAHDDPMLRSAYHACKVLAMPALLESPGLTGLEAALAGANLTITQNGSTREYFGEDAHYFDPRNTQQMRENVLQALEVQRSARMQQRVMEQFTWPRIAVMQLAAYEKILA